ncbi:MAG: right-handed parallel beta-helix repeat-containing protein [Paludibacter sp.]
MNRFYIAIFSFCLLSFSMIANTYYVSKTGNDKNKGTRKSPFLSISKGAEKAEPGDTVFVCEGVYRERVSPPWGGLAGRPIVYMGEPNKNVIIKGSDVWKPKWNKLSASIYYAVPDEKMFNDDCYKDNKNPFKVASSSTPYQREGKAELYFGFPGDSTIVYTIGQVFVDGNMFIQHPFLSEVKENENTWYYDTKSGNIYIHFSDDNPEKKTVEISTRRRIFAPHKRQLGYITVQGFVMEHCANQYSANFWEAKHPEWQQAGALGTRSGHHWVIKNNVIRFANGSGIDFGNEGNKDVDLETGENGQASGARNIVIDSNWITDNGAAGTAAYYPQYITFSNNVVERNINLNFLGKKRWESGAVKMHSPSNTIVTNNLLRDNYGKWGMWFDQGAGKNTRVHGNLIIGSKVGFDQEIGTASVDKLILDNNVLIDNTIGIGCRESGGITAIHNLILGSTDAAVKNHVDKSRGGSWSSDIHYYFNNVIAGCKTALSICSPDYYRSSDRRFDFNVYQVNANEKQFKINEDSKDSLSFTAWKMRWNDYNKAEFCDKNSVVLNEIRYEFDKSNLKLYISVPQAFFQIKTLHYQTVINDFMNNAIPTENAQPGAFQNLKAGMNEIKLWDGLKPLKCNELPYK